MGRIDYCPIIGGQCNKSEPQIIAQKDSFFLAEPFKPEQERKRRERAVKNALRDALKEIFSGKSLRVADKEPKEPAIFCEICRLIQSSAYGIVDISGPNPNVLIELGMMFCLGKPVFVLVKKGEEEDLKEKIPSDIVWKRVIAYEEFIDIEEELSKQIQKRPYVEPEPPLAEEAKKLIAEVAPSLAKQMDTVLHEIKREQAQGLSKLEKMLKQAGLGETIAQEKKIEIPFSLEKIIDELDSKVERIEKLVGEHKDPEIAFLRGNWHYHRKEYEKALNAYNFSLTLKRDFLEAWFNKGVTLHSLERYEEAIVSFDKAMEIRKDYLEALNGKGIALSNIGRWEEAKYCFEEALKINPNNISYLQNLSETLIIIGDLKNGLGTAQKALFLAKEARYKATSWLLCISAYFFRGENERVLEEIKSFINYFKGLEKDFKVTEWDFSPLLATVKERLRGKNKRKLLLLISLLKGEIRLKEFERSIKNS